jgi:nucleoid-associated protein EbfC
MNGEAMKGGIGNLMKQAQLVQENMKKLQEQLGTMEVEGQAGSGMVKVVMSGRHEVKRVTLDPRALADDREMLEDLIAAAVNDAVRKIETVTQEKMAAATAGLPLPPGMKLPF